MALPRATTWPTVSPLLKPVEAYPITVRPSSSSRRGRSISGHVLHTAYFLNSKPATNITIPWWRSSKCRPPGRFEFRTRITIPPPRLRQWVSCSLFLLSHCKPDERSLQEVSAILPPEILDKILEHIPGTNRKERRRTLIACALMASWWTGPSQRCLFSSAEIHRGNYKQWIDGVFRSGSKDHLLGYVRLLCMAFPWYGPKHRSKTTPHVESTFRGYTVSTASRSTASGSNVSKE